MSDDVKAPQVESTSAAEHKAETIDAPDVAELKSQLEEMKSRFNGMQRILSERDKEKAELERQAEESKRSKMSELEKLKEDVAKQQEETARWMREAKIKENTMKAKDKLSEIGLPMSTLDIMDVSSDESLEASLEKVAKIADEIRKNASQEFAAKYGQSAPKTGQGDAIKAPASLKEAKSRDEKIAYLKAQRAG